MLLPVAVIGEAQQPGKIRRIGFLAVNTPSADKHLDEAFKQSLRELGWIEGRNITIEYRSAEGNADRLPALAAELVDSKVDVIVSPGGTPGAQIALDRALTLEADAEAHDQQRPNREALEARMKTM